MVFIFAGIQIFRFWQKTMDYSKAFYPSQLPTLQSGGQLFPGAWIERVVGLPALRLDPLVADEVAKRALVVVQPGVDHAGGLRGGAILQAFKQLCHTRPLFGC